MSVSTIGGGRGYDDSVPGEVTKTAPSGDRTTCRRPSGLVGKLHIC